MAERHAQPSLLTGRQPDTAMLDTARPGRCSTQNKASRRQPEQKAQTQAVYRAEALMHYGGPMLRRRFSSQKQAATFGKEVLDHHVLAIRYPHAATLAKNLEVCFDTSLGRRTSGAAVGKYKILLNPSKACHTIMLHEVAHLLVVSDPRFDKQPTSARRARSGVHVSDAGPGPNQIRQSDPILAAQKLPTPQSGVADPRRCFACRAHHNPLTDCCLPRSAALTAVGRCATTNHSSPVAGLASADPVMGGLDGYSGT